MTKKFISTLLFILAAGLFLIQSCKKEQQEKKLPETNQICFSVSEAKNWFVKHSIIPKINSSSANKDISGRAKSMQLKTLIMRYRYFIVINLLIFSCRPAKGPVSEIGKVTCEKKNGNADSTAIRGNIYELSTGNKLKLSDIWIGNKRYECDTTGHFLLNINPGKYNIEARGFGFKNYKYKLSIKKGEIFSLLFYLVPFKNERSYKQIH